jgi:hypothetical protein
VTGFFSTNKYGSVGVRLFRSVQELANDLSTSLQKLAVFQLEGIQSIAVDVNFSDDTSACSDRRHDFRLSAQRALKISRIRRSILHDDCLIAPYSGTADSLRHRNALVRSGLSVKWTEYENR